MEHSQECKKARDEIMRKFKEWENLHPNYCRACNGRGGAYEPGDQVPWGSTVASLPDIFEPCPECVERGICPWCGDGGLTSEDRGDESTGDGPCRVCGHDPLTECTPSPSFDCFCQYDEDDRSF